MVRKKTILRNYATREPTIRALTTHRSVCYLPLWTPHTCPKAGATMSPHGESEAPEGQGLVPDAQRAGGPALQGTSLPSKQEEERYPSFLIAQSLLAPRNHQTWGRSQAALRTRPSPKSSHHPVCSNTSRQSPLPSSGCTPHSRGGGLGFLGTLPPTLACESWPDC